MTETFLFLKSNRFWVMIGICVLSILKVYGVIESGIADALIGLGLGFIGVRTVDRFAEKASNIKVEQ